MNPTLAPTARIEGGIVQGGTIEGVIRGGTITGGFIDHRTVVLDGSIHGGSLRQCVVHGGTIYDIDAENVTIWGGVYRGGTPRSQDDILVLGDRSEQPIVTLVRDDSPPYYRACVGDRLADLNAAENAVRFVWNRMIVNTQMLEYVPIVDQIRARVASWTAGR